MPLHCTQLQTHQESQTLLVLLLQTLSDLAEAELPVPGETNIASDLWDKSLTCGQVQLPGEPLSVITQTVCGLHAARVHSS